MQILITGGTGLIGKQLCKALLAEGHELTVFSRNPASVPAKCGSGVHAMVRSASGMPVKSFDAVINLAGEPIVDAPGRRAQADFVGQPRHSHRGAGQAYRFRRAQASRIVKRFGSRLLRQSRRYRDV